MNAMRAATLPGYGTEAPAHLGENLPGRVGGEPARFRPDLRVVRGAGVRAAVPAVSAATAPPGLAPALVAPAQPASAQPASARPASARPAPAWSAPARPVPATSPLRLTRRGRIVVGVMVALLVAGLSLAAAGAAQAIGRSVPKRASGASLTRIVVRPGQSLWSVAQSADPNADPRQVIQQIAQLNALTSDTVMVGQQLWVPRG
jgi:hypothetical protein